MSFYLRNDCNLNKNKSKSYNNINHNQNINDREKWWERNEYDQYGWEVGSYDKMDECGKKCYHLGPGQTFAQCYGFCKHNPGKPNPYLDEDKVQPKPEPEPDYPWDDEEWDTKPFTPGWQSDYYPWKPDKSWDQPNWQGPWENQGWGQKPDWQGGLGPFSPSWQSDPNGGPLGPIWQSESYEPQQGGPLGGSSYF